MPLNDELQLQGFESSCQHILADLERIDILIRHQVSRARQLNQTDQDYKGLYISEQEIDSLLSHPTGLPLWATQPVSPADSDIRQILGHLQDRIETRASLPSTRKDVLRLDKLVDHFQLTPFERNVCLVCLAPECDLRYERLFAYLQDDVTKKRPTVDLVLNLLSSSVEEKFRQRQIFSSTGPLLKHHLVTLFEDPAHPHSPLLGTFLKIDERVAGYLLDSNHCDSRLQDIVTVLTPRNTWESWKGLPAFRERLHNLVQQHSILESGTMLYFQGPYGIGKQHAAEALCHDLGLHLLKIDTARLVRLDTVSFEMAVTLIQREAFFQQALPFWAQADVLFSEDKERERSTLWKAVESSQCPMILAGTIPWEPEDASIKPAFFRIAFPRPDYSDRIQWWTHTLNGQAPDNAKTAIETLANTFRLTGGQIANAALTAKKLARWRQPGLDPLSMDDLFQACRLQTLGSLGTLARQLTPCHTWDDIVLPPEHRQQLKEICHAMTYRSLVYDQWGFGQKQSLGKGLNVLFSGPSGTGKTMAAGILANELQLDIYQIDLSRVVSKYIGETEKHLSRIFTEAESSNAILFFDEADALFGKRSEVRDAHDRYANIEVGYLLQKMEEYQGMVILASNFRKNMDEAFIRRMHLTIEFPYPTAQDRLEIWKRMWPHAVPRSEDIDMSFLAEQFEMTGGNIRNIALASAFLAADETGVVTLAHVLRATRREYQKMGKVLSDDDFLHHRAKQAHNTDTDSHTGEVGNSH